jgi:tetratricopeptide (TPR) repeat protein
MQANKTFINFSITTAFLSFLIFSNTACVEQNASLKESPAGSKNSEKVVPVNKDIKAAEDLIKKAPDSPAGYIQLAATYIRAARASGDFSLNSKAESAINRALELAPENPNAQKLQASLLLTFHRFPEALAAGKNLIQKYPQDAFGYGVLTDANVELGNYKEAVETAQKMVDLRPNMESFARVAHIRSLYGDTEGAIKAMSQATAMTHPQDKESKTWCFVQLGNEYFKAGSYKEAEAAYDAALKILPQYHYALAGKGQARMAAGDYENAIKFLTESQERVPLTETVIALGNLYQKTGNAEKANEQYKLVEVIEQKLGANNDQRSLALFWADQDIKLDEALEIAAREHANRKDVYTADVYAWCLYKKGRFAEAETAIKEAMRIKNKDARIFYHAGMIEKALGNKKEARELLQNAIQINPAFDLLQAENAKRALQELN